MYLRFCVLLATLLLGGAAQADPATDQFNFAEAMFINQDYRSAGEEYQAFLKKHPEATQAATARFRIGECFYRQGQHEAAAKAYGEALAKTPDAKDAPLGAYNLGRAWLELKQPEQALTAFQTAAKTGDETLREEATIAAGECLIQLKRHADAAAHYRAALTAFPASRHRPDMLFTLGWSLLQEKQYKEAVAPLEELLAKHPDFAALDKVKLALSDACTELGQFDRATTLLKQMWEADQTASPVLLRLAWCRLKSGANAEAAATFLDFAKRLPNDEQVASALFNAGIVAYNAGDYPAAIEAFNQLRTARPQSPEAVDMQLWLGTACFQAQQYEAAIQELTAVLTAAKLDAPRLGIAAYTLAEAKAALGKHAEAIAAFTAVVEKYPDSPYVANSLYSRATAQQASGDLEGAVASLRLLLERQPAAELRVPALFALGEYLFQLKQYEAALPHLRELAGLAQTQDPDHVLYRLAWTEYQLDQLAAAQATFEKLAGRESPYRDEARYMAGMAAEKLDAKTAIAHYEVLAKTNGTGEFIEKAMYRLAFLYEGDAAIANVERYRQRFPTGQWYAPMRLKIADYHLRLDEIAKARPIYQALVAETLPPELLATAWYGLGWCQLKQDELAAAAASFARVAPDQVEATMADDALRQRAEIAYRQAQHPAAAALFAQLKDRPDALGERATYMLGWCAIHQQEPKVAAPHFRALITRFPDGKFYADSAMRLAAILKDEGRFDEARTVLESGLPKVAADQKEAMSHLYCDLLVATKDWQALIDVTQKLQQDYPDTPRQALLSFRLGLAYKALGILDKAETAFRATIAGDDPGQAAKAQFNLATLYYTRKDYLEAAKQFLRVEALYDDPELAPKALYQAIDAFILGEGKESQRVAPHLERLRKLYPDSPWRTKADDLLKDGQPTPPEAP